MNNATGGSAPRPAPPTPAQPAAVNPTGGQPPTRRRGRGRRPAAEVRSDVLQTAERLLLQTGMGGFTIEGVAIESGVSKTTIYKWWPTKGALAFDSYFHATEDELRFPDTGDIAADLRAQLHSHVALVGGPTGRVLAGLVAEAQHDPELAAEMRERYTAPRRRLAVEAIERAQARGQIRATADPEVLVDQLWGAVYHRLLLTGLPITPEFADRALANLLDSIRPVAALHDRTDPGGGRGSAPSRQITPRLSP